MNKNLPRVYVSPINKELRNNKDVFYSSESRHESNINIPQKINEIFANPHHVYKSKVRITTKDNSFDTVIVGQNNHELLTLDGSRININDLIDIERI